MKSMKPGSNKFTEKTPSPLKSINEEATPMSPKVRKEKLKAVWKSLLIDWAIAYYACFGSATLWSIFSGEGQQLSSSVMILIAPISLVWAIALMKFSFSLGKILVYRTNPILKAEHREAFRWTSSVSGIYAIYVLVMTMVLGWLLNEVDPVALFDEAGIDGVWRIFSSLLSPDLSILSLVFNAMVVTVYIALMATSIAIPFSFVLSFLCARNLMDFSKTSRAVYGGLRFLFNFSRSIEPLIWAIVFSVWVGIGAFAGMMALMIHSIASLAKLYSEQIESIDRGPIEAIEATGANRIQVVWYAVVPQVVLPFLSYTIYRWDINVRMATIIGLVGGGGVGTLLMQYQGLAKWNAVGTIVIMIAIVVWLMDWLSSKIRQAIY
jgi:phosphonate ABC transporter permease subunit PhnE